MAKKDLRREGLYRSSEQTNSSYYSCETRSNLIACLFIMSCFIISSRNKLMPSKCLSDGSSFSLENSRRAFFNFWLFMEHKISYFFHRYKKLFEGSSLCKVNMANVRSFFTVLKTCSKFTVFAKLLCQIFVKKCSWLNLS